MKNFYILFLLTFVACSDEKTKPMDFKKQISITQSDYGKIGEEQVHLFTLKNKNNTTVSITNYGGIITSIETADKKGKFDDIVLGYDSLAHYAEKTPYFGAIIGRYANRIAGGKFILEGHEYQLTTNNGPNALHGGVKGFDKQIWNAESFENEEELVLKLKRISPDMEEGYPGKLSLQVTYTLNNEDELHIDYAATAVETTIINLCNHSYFNLKGANSGSIKDHILQMNADRFTPLNENSIPTGKLRFVKNTPFDFTKTQAIGARINETDNEQIKIGNGYDHNFVLNKEGQELSLAATVYEPTTGRVLEVLTTEPGVQLYTANYLGGKFKGKKGHAYQSRDAFCLETQHFPNSPNQENFPSTVLKAGERYDSKTVFKFSTRH